MVAKRGSFLIKEPYKKVAWMVLRSNFFNGILTSLQLEGACATSPSPTSPSPLPCVSVKNRQRLSGNEGKRRIFHVMGTVPSFFVNCSMEFLFGPKMNCYFENCIEGGPYDFITFLRNNFF